MTYFSAALNAALRLTHLSQARLSERADLNLSQISQYCLGTSLPPVDSLNSILEQFEFNDRLKLIAAYVQDHIPPEAAHLVSVNTLGSEHVEVQIAREAVCSLPQDIRSEILQLQMKKKSTVCESTPIL